MSLTENRSMKPGRGVSGLYFNHPGSRYFAVGKLAADQVSDCAARKGSPLAEIEKWLGPYLDLDPGK